MAVHSQSNLIGVIGGKGGVGKSVFAANLAISLFIETKQPVLLIDADARSAGDQNVLLGVRPIKTLFEVGQFQGSLTVNTLNQVLTPHSSGIYFLGAVRSADEIFKTSFDSFEKVLEVISSAFRYIVIDLGNDLQDFQVEVLRCATLGLIVSVPEVLVVNQTQRLMSDLLSQTFPKDMFGLVLNKVGANSLAVNVVAQSLGMPAIGMIPSDEALVNFSLARSQPFVISQKQSAVSMAYTEITRRLNGGLLTQLKAIQRPMLIPTQAKGASSSENRGENDLDPRNVLKMRIHHELIRAMDLKKGIADTQGDKAKEEQLRQKTLATITQIVDREAPGTAREERSKLIKEVLEEALGLGPLEDLLADPAVTEIMVNGYQRIFLEKNGKIVLSPVTFTSNMHLRNVIERIVTPIGRRIDEKNPMVDARLKDGSRVNAVIEPLSIDGPALTIRKFKKGGISPQKYIEYGSLTQGMLDFLKICVENGLNVVISGGTGSGKTSLLNMLSSFIPSNERIITVEDAAELQLQQEHVVRLETRPANMEGTGIITIRDLIRNALRMRPNRIIVGETRDGAALDMLQAMNTGHDGSMTTTHANSPRECIGRLETLCLMAGMDLPVRAIREQISSAVQLIVQISRLSDGSRKVTSITEVCGMQGETVTLQEIFRFKETGFDKNRRILGQFQAMGFIPTFVEKLEQKGVIISRDIFSNQPVKSGVGGSQEIRAQNSQVVRPGVTPVSLFKPTGTGSGGKKG